MSAPISTREVAAAQLLPKEALGDGGHQHRQVIFQPGLEVRRSSQGRLRTRRAGAAARSGNSG